MKVIRAEDKEFENLKIENLKMRENALEDYGMGNFRNMGFRDGDQERWLEFKNKFQSYLCHCNFKL
jgi:hypothetical protein